LIIDGLGKPVEEIFREFSSEPIAAASLGQVRESMVNVNIFVQNPWNLNASPICGFLIPKEQYMDSESLINMCRYLFQDQTH
jgi:hypothetical protein